MAQTPEGAIKCAARRAGISVETYKEQVAAGLKWCWHCRMWKPVNGFGRDVTRHDGRDAKCSSCRRVPAKQARLLLETPGEYARRRYATNERYRHRCIENTRQRKKHVDPMPFEAAQILLERSEGLCLYCPEPATTWDHIVPVSMGGRTVPNNMAPACHSCNSKKRNFHVFAFIEKHKVEWTPRLEDFICTALSWGQLDTDESEYPFLRGGSERFYELNPDLRVRQFPQVVA